MVDYLPQSYNHVKHCTTHPKFLHSNSTSHRWVFGAIAELIDNAIDPDVSASQFCIDMKEFNGEPCLVFMDNGCGLGPEKLHKMLSFGHSKKQMTPGDKSIGKHGNGFKSGTMRLGKDVLVLTKCTTSMTAGFLSQTFLAATAAEDILIPQVSWDLQGNRLSPMDLEIEESLNAICGYSIFPDEDSLLAQLEAIPHTGAILIISNLRRHEGVLELDFEKDPHDIRITSEINSSQFQQLRPNQPNTTEVPMDYSLRAYVSILYKVPRMQIFIRDKKVKTKRIAGILSQKETETYKPFGLTETIKIELGFNTENKNLYGMMLYHRNRLIKAYMRVGMQLEENERGMGVIGLAEADFLQPTHNKQDFDDTTAYRRLLKKLSDVLAEYWWEKKERVPQAPLAQPDQRAMRRGSGSIGSQPEDVPDVIWVQCDNPICLKWRILPPGTDVTSLPDIWFCEYHPDARFRRHDEAEQEWDTSVPHEIVERRKERKREYDREKKEREAERKRQRLEAATRDAQAMLQKQREVLQKEVQDQQAREQLALKEQKRREEEIMKLNEEQKRREEEMMKLNEEYAAMEAKRDEIFRQHAELERNLELAKEELAQKAKERQEHEKEVTPIQSTGNVSEMQVPEMAEGDSTILMDVGEEANVEKGVSHTVTEKRAGKPDDALSQDVSRAPLSPTEPHQFPLEIDMPSVASPDVTGGRQPETTPVTSSLQQIQKARAQSIRNARSTSLAALSKELIARGTLALAQQPQHKAAVLAASNSSQTVLLEGSQRPLASHARSTNRSWASHRETERPPQRIEKRERLTSGTVSTPIPPSTSPTPPSSFTPPIGLVPLQARTTSTFTQGFMQTVTPHRVLPPSRTDNRGTGSASGVMVVAPALATPINERVNFVNTEQGKSQGQGDHQYNGHVLSGSGDPLDTSPSRTSLQERTGDQQLQSTSFGSGLLSVHLPLDSMVSKTRSQADIILDNTVSMLQRHLRLALTALADIGGLLDSNRFEFEVPPTTDNAMVSICEKAKQNVEMEMRQYKQEVANLKAELACLMADKRQVNSLR